MTTKNLKNRKEGVFISGKNINLTVLSEKDVKESNWHDWFNNENTTMFMEKHHYPISKDEQLDFVKQLNKTKDKIQLGICDVSGGPIVGIISLQDIDLINSRAETAIIIGEEKYRNVKYFIEAFELLLDHGFNSLGLNKIYGGTVIKEVAELMCRTLGFKQEGILNGEVFKCGKYLDVYRIGLLKDEYLFNKNRG